MLCRLCSSIVAHDVTFPGLLLCTMHQTCIMPVANCRFIFFNKTQTNKPERVNSCYPLCSRVLGEMSLLLMSWSESARKFGTFMLDSRELFVWSETVHWGICLQAAVLTLFESFEFAKRCNTFAATSVNF